MRRTKSHEISRDAKDQSGTRLHVKVQKTWRRCRRASYLSTQTFSGFKPTIAKVFPLVSTKLWILERYVYIVKISHDRQEKHRVCAIYQMREKVGAELPKFPQNKMKTKRRMIGLKQSQSPSCHTALQLSQGNTFVRHNRNACQSIPKQMDVSS